MSLADKVSFMKLSSVLNEVGSSKKDQKPNILRRFINQFQTEARNLSVQFCEAQSFYPILRLIIPTNDRKRGPYGIKEYTLSKLYVKILCLNKNTKDYNVLTQYKAPKSGISNEVGNFSEVAYSVLKNRCGKGGELSVTDVNVHLDNIATKHASHDPRGVEMELQVMLSKMSALEQKWLIRMLLKDLHLGMGASSLLDTFHVDARDLYDVCHNLEKVCSVLHNPNIRLHEIEVVLFDPFRPMLSQRLDIQNIDKDLRAKEFYFVEPKYDGERFQLHLSEGKFKYFSRNGFEYTKTYGDDSSNGILTPQISNQFHSSVRNCILDGEMMCWNTKYKNFTTKGGNIDVKKLRIGNIHQACFCVFDILLHNGTVLTNQPLRQRLDILKKVFTSKEGFIVHTSRSTINSKSQVLSALNKAIEDREEGIVVKEPDAIYRPNSRKDGWYKIKPEYTAGAMVELDMLIIGGYYGKGSQRGIVSQFLLGLAHFTGGRDEPDHFESAGKVGIGLSMEELVDLSQKMSPYWKKTKPGEIPTMIEWTREKPDLWLPPQQSYVLQVKATEVVQSDGFKVNYCLRFPRVEKVRYDKTYKDVLSVEEFHRIRTMGDGKLCYTSIAMNRTLNTNQRANHKRKEIVVSNEYQCNIQNGVTLVSHIFKNKTICVMTGGDIETKNNLELKILENGGQVVQNSGKTTWCIVVSNENNIRVKNAIQAKKNNVVRADWLEKCSEKKFIFDWTPEDVLSLVGEAQEEMNDKYDQYGDSFTKHINVEQLKQLLDEMKSHPTPILTPDEVIDFERTIFHKKLNPKAMFRQLYAFFKNNSCSKLSQLKFKFYGGKICDEINEITTHIVVDEQEVEKTKSETVHVKLILINEKWILDCIAAKTLISLPYKKS